jgi:hypothetical protein
MQAPCLDMLRLEWGNAQSQLRQPTADAVMIA